ncbi:MAG TPA: P-II family nitrogen regulator [Pseudomonas sp.]|nr:P-II family nitrogen regulator [Pseudomonas sp.]
MKAEGITYLTDVALITCIVSAGRADLVIRAAQGMGAPGAIVYHAHGLGPRERLGLLSIAIDAEKEVVSLLVAADYQDEVLETIYRSAGLDVPGAGMIYATPVEKVATYIPRAILEKGQVS